MEATVSKIDTSSSDALPHGHFIAENLHNPRGMCRLPDGSILVAEAGTGHADAAFSGRIRRLRPDARNPGRYLPPEVVADGFRSINTQHHMLRDEIMGLADIALGGGLCLASQTNYVEGSRLLELSDSRPRTRFFTTGNLNALCHHPQRNRWLAVKPDQDLLVEFSTANGEQTLAHLPKFPHGQDAVPVSLTVEAATGAVLISLFSGETGRNPARKGMDFEDHCGQIIRVRPDTGHVETLITGLQFPTDLALETSRHLLVLELCDRLLEPLTEDWSGEARHGGYARFSGRLLRIDLHSGKTTVLATQLDTPSNLCLLPGRQLLISEGMGLTGRPLPTPDNRVVPLTGRIRIVDLETSA